MGDTASLGSFIARSSEACAAVVIAERHPSDQPGWLVVVSPRGANIYKMWNLGTHYFLQINRNGLAKNAVSHRDLRQSAGVSARSNPHVAHAQQRPARAPRSRLICIWRFFTTTDWRHVHSPPSLKVLCLAV